MTSPSNSMSSYSVFCIPVEIEAAISRARKFQALFRDSNPSAHRVVAATTASQVRNAQQHPQDTATVMSSC